VTGSVIVDAALAREWPVLLNALRHLVLPAAVLSFYGVGLMTRMVRGSMIDVLSEDYMRTARAKGLPTFLVLLRHALRNGLIPIVTVVGLNLGNLLSGSVVVETVFAWPGLGRYAFQTAMSIDFAAIMGFAMIVTVVYLLMNLLVDTAYIVIDPRLRFD
jgi:peptide/nickel transport system permease protein